jgi:hypothetical protein
MRQVARLVARLLRFRTTGASMTDVKSLVIGALLVAVAVLGYVLWERQRNTVEIRLPSVTIEKK